MFMPTTIPRHIRETMIIRLQTHKAESLLTGIIVEKPGSFSEENKTKYCIDIKLPLNYSLEQHKNISTFYL